MMNKDLRVDFRNRTMNFLINNRLTILSFNNPHYLVIRSISIEILFFGKNAYSLLGKFDIVGAIEGLTIQGSELT